MKEIQVVAIYDYESTDQQSLSFKKGDSIRVITRLPSGWWMGELDGKRGWFPSNYVTLPELKVEPEQPIPEPEAADQLGIQTQNTLIEETLTLPDHWGIKSLSNGKHYYFNILTNETKWSLREIHQQIDDVHNKDAQGDIAINNAEFTWDGMLAFVLAKLRILIRDIELKAKENYLSNTSSAVEAIRTMLYACDSAAATSETLNLSPKLKHGHTLILNWVSRLILSAKLSSTVWPPPDASDDFLQSAHELVGAVKLFITEASELKLSIHQLAPEDLVQLQHAQFDTDHIGQSKTDAELVERLEEITLNLFNLINQIGELSGGKEGETFQRTEIFELIRKVVKEVGSFLALIDELPLESLFEDLTIDFKVNRLALLNCVTDLVMSTQAAARLKDEKQAHEKIMIAIDLVNKASKDLLISTKFLIEEKENMEHATLKSYIENYSAPAPQNAQKGLHKAASRTFNEHSNRNSKSDVSFLTRSSVLYAEGSETPHSRRSSIGFDSNVDLQKLSVAIRNSRLSNASGPESPTSASLEKYTEALGDRNRYSIIKSGQIVNDIADAWYLATDYPAEELILNQDGKVKGGTLKVLVEYLTGHRHIDEYFNTSFLLSYRTFTTNKELFPLLFARFNLPIPNSLTNEEHQQWLGLKQKPIRQRVCTVLKNWIEFHCEGNPQDVQTLSDIESFNENQVKSILAISHISILKLIERKRKSGYQAFKPPSLKIKDKPPAPILPKNLKRFKVYELDPLEVARQITLWESSIYLDMSGLELLSKTWEWEEPKPMHVELLINISNHITNWVVYSILGVGDVKKRSRAFGFFIAVADRCAALSNFNGLMAILAAFNTPHIARLHKSWESINTKYLDVLKALRNLMSPEENFKAYRAAIKNCTPPCIPFVGVYLIDLSNINDLYPDNLPSHPDSVNFAKSCRIADTLKDSMIYTTEYSLKPVAEITGFLRVEIMTDHDESELEKMSFACEPKRIFKRLYAAKPQAAVAEKLEPLGYFIPRKPLDKLPNVKGISPQELNLPPHPRYRKEPQTLMRSIDYENQLRYDVDGRTRMFLSEKTVKPGAILLVEQVSSRLSPQSRSFAGVLMEVKRKGLASNITLRSVVMGTGVQMKIPIFSPMVTKITVLQEPPTELEGNTEPIYWAIEEPEKSGIDFENVENILLKYNNQKIKEKNAAAKLH
ncbi:hypothetical protein HK103_000666 [Boothiomyces macroporosus]|uniref:Ras GEF n=1 Tax=Boothiomyces macroporosus TaxID=261099 RepID=A0AAD5UKG9_9FUNG|nr:hypothetical protein HK103_000666 [Boothiomyces macroporosus]